MKLVAVADETVDRRLESEDHRSALRRGRDRLVAPDVDRCARLARIAVEVLVAIRFGNKVERAHIAGAHGGRRRQQTVVANRRREQLEVVRRLDACRIRRGSAAVDKAVSVGRRAIASQCGAAVLREQAVVHLVGIVAQRLPRIARKGAVYDCAREQVFDRAGRGFTPPVAHHKAVEQRRMAGARAVAVPRIAILDAAAHNAAAVHAAGAHRQAIRHDTVHDVAVKRVLPRGRAVHLNASCRGFGTFLAVLDGGSGAIRKRKSLDDRPLRLGVRRDADAADGVVAQAGIGCRVQRGRILPPDNPRRRRARYGFQRDRLAVDEHAVEQSAAGDGIRLASFVVVACRNKHRIARARRVNAFLNRLERLGP